MKFEVKFKMQTVIFQAVINHKLYQIVRLAL